MRYRLRPGQTDEVDDAWGRLWERVAPYWGEAETNVEIDGEQTGPIPVDVTVTGPRSLYEFDGDPVEDIAFEKLEPEVVTLV
ncbi:hypothetical protein CIB48_g10939 [Xylaria polymorpha]|nr:hypothetical protein CIB48_g10939 [Xylaria polymorpha]